VIPNVQSLTADYYRAEDRGKVFGTLHLTSAAGAALGGLYATNVGARRAARAARRARRRCQRGAGCALGSAVLPKPQLSAPRLPRQAAQRPSRGRAPPRSARAMQAARARSLCLT